MLDGFFMLFFSFNPIICGFLLAAGLAIALRPTPQHTRSLDLTSITPLRRWQPGAGLRQAGRR
jgi:hypothetical protein